MNMTPTVVEATLEFAEGLDDMIDMLVTGSGGSAQATLIMSNGAVEVFQWYYDEIVYTEDDFVGKTMDEIRQMHYERDVGYLRS